MAVTDVHGAPGWNHRFHRAVAAADDDIVAVEGEHLDRRGEQGEQVTVRAAGEGDRLDERRLNLPSLDDWRDLSRHAHQGKEGGVRIQVADRLENFLAAAHAGEPVVDQGDL